MLDLLAIQPELMEFELFFKLVSLGSWLDPDDDPIPTCVNTKLKNVETFQARLRFLQPDQDNI